MTLRRFARLSALLTAAALVPACESDFRRFGGPAPVGTAAAQLRGTQVVPATLSAATGTATLVVNATGIDFTVTHAGLGTITSVRVHSGAPGTNGPAIFDLGVSFTSPMTGTLTSPLLGTFAAARDLILNGNAYLLIATALNPLGEIRGQLGAATVASVKMSTAQVGIAGTGTGTATLQLNSAQTEITVTVTFTGLTSATAAAHVHVGAPGAAPGPAIFDLATIAFTSPLIVTLDAADFTAGGGLATFADAVGALLSGRLYVDIDTVTNPGPGGEIRGQVGPVQLEANPMDETFVLPAGSGTANTGIANIVLNGTQTAINVILNHTVSDPTGILIHSQPSALPAVNGPQIFDVEAGSGSMISPVARSLTASDLFPQAVHSIFTFPDAIDAMIVGRTYIDIASTNFPQGDIRGPIGP